jgi:hypothetical protein
VLELETPDLAVLSGDMLTGLNVDENATAYWDKLVGVLDARSIPHTALLGNHDAEPFSGTGANQSSPGAKTSRLELMAHDAQLPLSHSKIGPEALRPAVSVYVVDVFPHRAATALHPGERLREHLHPGGHTGVHSAERPVLQLFHLDSGGGGMPEMLYEDQIGWFNRTIAARRERWARSKRSTAGPQRGVGGGGGSSVEGTHNADVGVVPALVFVHIPLWEFQQALLDKHSCFGVAEDGITPTITNTGLFAALEAAPEVQAVFVGHDHCNDFCCQFGRRSIDLCFGRHSGYGGYDCTGYLKGSRLITFRTGARFGLEDGRAEDSTDAVATPGKRTAAAFAANWTLSTHIRLNTGSVVHKGVLA